MPKRSTLALIGMLCLLVVLGVLVLWAGGCAKPVAWAHAGEHEVNGEIVK